MHNPSFQHHEGPIDPALLKENQVQVAIDHDFNRIEFSVSPSALELLLLSSALGKLMLKCAVLPECEKEVHQEVVSLIKEAGHEICLASGAATTLFIEACAMAINELERRKTEN